MGGGLITGAYVNNKLIYGNRLIIRQLVEAIQESDIAKERITQINKEKTDLEQKIKTLAQDIGFFEKEKVLLREKATSDGLATAERLDNFNAQIAGLIQEKALLQDKLTALKQKENVAGGELSRIDKRKTGLEKANLDRMFNWLKIHQNPLTGLVMSFEGDSQIANWAFIYDQSLSAQAYTIFSDYGRARKILISFPKKQKKR